MTQVSLKCELLFYNNQELLQVLIKKKHPTLHEHIMMLTAVGVSTATNPFYELVNESLLRGLSGLLNLQTCQFVWDQCFLVGNKEVICLTSEQIV